MEEEKTTKTKEDLKWHPIFTGAKAEAVLAVVEDIARVLHCPPAAWVPVDRLAEPYRVARGASLAHGSAGIALFYAYLSRISGNVFAFEEEAGRFISHACDTLEKTSMSGGIYRGLSGIAWVVQHFQGLIYTDESYDPATDPNQDIDQILMDHWTKPEKFDLWEGCVGLGIYALERYPLPGSRVLLELLVKQLEELSINEDSGITWFTAPGFLPPRPRMIYPDGFFDLGIAHGQTGVISFLSRVYAKGISQELQDISGRLLYGAVSWFLAQQEQNANGPNETGLLFPEYVFPSGKTQSTTEGWCHGNVGMAAALLSAAANIGESSWETKAVEIALAAVENLNRKRPAQPTAYSDPDLCHGTAGLGHMFNRLYQGTGIQTFKEEAVKWFQRTISLRKPGTGIAGFSKFGINEDGEMDELYDPGFIQGAAGIGLALLAAVTNLEPSWDRLMMLSA